MTNNPEVLELAKKCGAIVQDVVPFDHRPEYRTITFNEPTFLAFAAALEGKRLAQSAMLVNLLSEAVAALRCRTVVGDAPERSKKQYYDLGRDHAIEKLQSMIAVLRNSAAQPEGKEWK